VDLWTAGGGQRETRCQSLIRSRCSHWGNSPLKTRLSAIWKLTMTHARFACRTSRLFRTFAGTLSATDRGEKQIGRVRPGPIEAGSVVFRGSFSLPLSAQSGPSVHYREITRCFQIAGMSAIGGISAKPVGNLDISSSHQCKRFVSVFHFKMTQYGAFSCKSAHLRLRRNVSITSYT
jgi:hypothetical protein